MGFLRRRPRQLAPPTTAAVVKALTACIVAYYVDNPAGGSLHIVTDDYNFEDHNVQFCIDWARKEHDEIGEALGEALIALPMAERAQACVPTLCLDCQHSEALHFLEVGEHGGYSCHGPCEIEGCPCRDLRRPERTA